jgi:cytochrome o ubiquinol oxidase subunit 3
MSTSAHELKQRNETTQLGFWIYLMTDLMLFSAFFATYMVLRHGQNGSVGPNEIIVPWYALVQTIVLLASSFTCGLAYVALKYKHKRQALTYLGATIVLGLVFLGMEINEFGTMLLEGHSWTSSAFLSGFFGLVGLHGLHIFTGIIWAIVLGDYISKKGITAHTLRKFGMFAVFWHFLDLVWIFIFSIVYMMGVAA